MSRCICPGSFDPITNGHLDLIRRAGAFFDEVIVGVLINVEKKPLFTQDERVELIERAVKGEKNVKVMCFEGLLVDFARQTGARAIVKGLRAVSDFEYEFQMASLNRHMDPELETLFIMTDTRFSYISSSMVRTIASLGGSISGLVPQCIERSILEKFETPL